jgi:hypothetical protein
MESSLEQAQQTIKEIQSSCSLTGLIRKGITAPLSLFTRGKPSSHKTLWQQLQEQTQSLNIDQRRKLTNWVDDKRAAQIWMSALSPLSLILLYGWYGFKINPLLSLGVILMISAGSQYSTLSEVKNFLNQTNPQPVPNFI